MFLEYIADLQPDAILYTGMQPSIDHLNIYHNKLHIISGEKIFGSSGKLIFFQGVYSLTQVMRLVQILPL